MAIVLNPISVRCSLNTILVRDDGELLGGAEPYLWSVFLKVDGETVTAHITLDDDDDLHLELRGTSTVRTRPGTSHGNLGSGVDAGSPKVLTVPVAAGRFTDELVPIPATIRIDPGSWLAETVDDAVLALDELIDALDSSGTCPPANGSAGVLLAELGAEFLSGVIGGVPGVFGGIYLLMEEDRTTHETADAARRALRDRLRDELDDSVIPGISLQQQGVSGTAMERIEQSVTEAVTEAFVSGINWWWLFLGLPGVIIGILDQDDPLGSWTETMSHLDIALGTTSRSFGGVLPDVGQGEWAVSGRIGTG